MRLICSAARVYLEKFYDEVVLIFREKGLEVETAPLTFIEACHLTQLITSQKISRCVADDEFVPVIVADSTPEVTDNITSPIRLKFTYEYSDQTDWL